MLPRIGLTGGIGAGKSTAAARFAQLGAVIIDADVIAREVVGIGSPGLAQIVKEFGAEMVGADGSLDRARLGSVVFDDPDMLTRLNAIIHPLVRQRSQELESAAARSVVVHDIPLLVENEMHPSFDEVVVVEAPIGLRLKRLVGRGMTSEQAESRMANQSTDEQRRAVATAVLDNRGSVAELNAQVDVLWERFQRV
jgi:dephospho-CoA kinase